MTSVHSQQYSLRWNNYLRHITYAFENLRTNDDFVDVTLCCDGHKIKAHKMLLSACSGYFKEIFKDNPHPHPIIIFKFIKYEDLNSIIEFMYQGEVNVQQEALQSFLQTAELLAVQGLTSDEKPKIPKSPIEEDIIKNIPSSIRTVTENNTTQTQTQTIELQTVQTVPIQNILKKRKISYNDDDEGTTVYTTSEPVTYKEDSRNIVKGSTEMQYLPTDKLDIPEYIDVSDCNQIADTTQTSQTDQNTSQSVTQFTSEYEILTESEIDDKFPHSDSAENSDLIQMDRLLTSQESIERSKDEKSVISQDLPNSKWTECQFCKMVITTVNLWRHIRTQHTPQPPRKCEHCHKNFKNKYSLREHIRISHEQKSITIKEEN